VSSHQETLKISKKLSKNEEKKMEKIWTLIKKFAKEEEGMETVEYAVVAALVIAVTVLVWQNLGTAIKSRIEALTNAIT
jgi:pilus assembly protein Flp/PilA